MKKILLTALVLLSFSALANLKVEDLDSTTITGATNIYNTLTSKVDGLKNPTCLAFGARRVDENFDLRVATGQFISSLVFGRKIVVIDDKAVEVLTVKVGFKTQNGADSGWQNFNCAIIN